MATIVITKKSFGRKYDRYRRSSFVIYFPVTRSLVDTKFSILFITVSFSAYSTNKIYPTDLSWIIKKLDGKNILCPANIEQFVLSLVYSDPTNSPFVYRKLSTNTEFMVDEGGYVKIEHYDSILETIPII